MAVSDRSAAGCWLGSTDTWTSVFQILEQISTIFISADSCCCCWLHYEILEGQPLYSGTGAVCMRTALFTDVGIYEACNNKVRYYRKSVMRRVYLGE